MKNRKNIFLRGIFLSLLFLWPALVAAQPAQIVNKQVEEALLAENWQKVVDLLDNVTARTPSPILRLIKGHATLALNRNNESLCLFLSASNENDLKVWDEWTEKFAEKNPGKAIKHYFKGDAFARQKKWSEAVEEFSEALSIKPNSIHALIKNARGVVYAKLNELSKARSDFDDAVEFSNFSFADAYANLGTYWIQIKEGPEGAIRAFNGALRLSPQFALALHGRGCAELILKKEAKRDLEQALNNAPCFKHLLIENHLRYAMRVSGANPEHLIADAREAGTMFMKKYSVGELGNSATGWFSTADNLRKMNGLPFNQHLANFCGNRGVERLEKMEAQHGMPTVTKWANDNSDTGAVARYDVNRVGNYNKNAMPYAKMTQDLGAIAGIGGSLFGQNWLGAAAKATEFGGRKSLEWSGIHAGFNDRFRGASSGNMSIVTPAYQPYRDAGGVDQDLSQINWDDGDWPFKEIHGLAYEIMETTEFVSTMSGGQK